MTDYPRRLERLRAAVAAAAAAAPALLVSGTANVRYLSGFTGSQGALVVDRKRALLVSDFRYRFQAAEEAPSFEFVEVERWVEGLAGAIRGLGHAAVGFESAHFTCQAHAKLAAALDDVALVAVDGLVEKMRAVKDAQELALIEQAAVVSRGAVEEVMALIRPGVRERDLALAAEDYIRKEAGAELAFPPIIASGPRSAQCHGEPGPRELAVGDLVVIDLGARWQGYGADITRTVAVGKAAERQREIYALCRRAQQEALGALRAGMACAELDGVARAIIEEAGYGAHFGHGLGHGVGLEPHEAPRVSRTSEDSLATGMTVTVEPGIYLAEVGGVRLEDLVAVTEDGRRVLTHALPAAELPEVG